MPHDMFSLIRSVAQENDLDPDTCPSYTFACLFATQCITGVMSRDDAPGFIAGHVDGMREVPHAITAFNAYITALHGAMKNDLEALRVPE